MTRSTIETRKIQTVKGGTFTVSLPKEWAQSEGLEQGTPVTISSHIDGLLLIQPGTRENDSTYHVTVDISAEGIDDIQYLIWAAYVAGVDEMTLTGPDTMIETHRQSVRDIVHVLAGVTIKSDGDGQLTVQMLLDSEEISVRQLVRQLGFAALSMHREAMAVLTDTDTVTTLADRDDQADRLYAMVDRSFTRTLLYLEEVDALGLTRLELFELWTTARELERIADHAERIATIGVEHQRGLPYEDDFVRTSRLARSVVEDAVDSIVGDAPMSVARDALGVRDTVREETASLNRRLFEESASEYHHVRILDSIMRTAEHGGNIAQRGIQAAFRRENTPAPTVAATKRETTGEWQAGESG